MNAEISKSQARAMRLLGMRTVGSYEDAAAALESAGYRKDGIPFGETWRTAAKLTDAKLLSGIAINHADLADSVIEY